MSGTQIKILEANRKFYTEIAAKHNRTIPYISRKNTRLFYEKLFLKILRENDVSLNNTRVLELGCGTGNFVPFLLRHDIKSYVGVDLSPGMIEFSKENITSIPTNIPVEFVVGAADDFVEKAKSQDEKFDVIFSFSFLHHLYNPQQFLLELQSIISPGGIYVALHEPNQKAIRGFWLKLDNLVAFIMGYDTVEFSLKIRIKHVLKNILRKVFSFRRTGREEEPEFDYVEYQLNPQAFTPGIFKELFDNNAKISEKIRKYDYFVYAVFRLLSKPINNYFHVVVKEKK